MWQCDPCHLTLILVLKIEKQIENEKESKIKMKGLDKN